jgi:hypothetical protein
VTAARGADLGADGWEPAGGRCGPDSADGVVSVTVAAAAIHDKQFFIVSVPATCVEVLIFSRLNHKIN